MLPLSELSKPLETCYNKTISRQEKTLLSSEERSRQTGHGFKDEGHQREFFCVINDQIPQQVQLVIFEVADNGIENWSLRSTTTTTRLTKAKLITIIINYVIGKNFVIACVTLLSFDRRLFRKDKHLKINFISWVKSYSTLSDQGAEIALKLIIDMLIPVTFVKVLVDLRELLAASKTPFPFHFSVNNKQIWSMSFLFYVAHSASQVKSLLLDFNMFYTIDYNNIFIWLIYIFIVFIFSISVAFSF